MHDLKDILSTDKNEKFGHHWNFQLDSVQKYTKIWILKMHWKILE